MRQIEQTDTMGLINCSNLATLAKQKQPRCKPLIQKDYATTTVATQKDPAGATWNVSALTTTTLTRYPQKASWDGIFLYRWMSILILDETNKVEYNHAQPTLGFPYGDPRSAPQLSVTQGRRDKDQVCCQLLGNIGANEVKGISIAVLEQSIGHQVAIASHYIGCHRKTKMNCTNAVYFRIKL